ncbi:MAG: hypothetical protein KQH83_12060 [Actinobacteria bacterium]|nr:hypothetical protein [Actinomycetota bacterium]
MKVSKRIVWMVGAWLAATAATAGVALAVVGLAGEQVSDEAVRPLTAEQVDALGVAATAATQPATTTTAAPGTTVTTAPPVSTSTTATTVPDDGTTTMAPTTTEAATTTTSGAQVDSRHVTGGTVVVRWTSSSVDLVSATPDDGYKLEVEDRGPDEVVVEFEGQGVKSTYHAEVSDGHLVVEASVEDDD